MLEGLMDPLQNLVSFGSRSPLSLETKGNDFYNSGILIKLYEEVCSKLFRSQSQAKSSILLFLKDTCTIDIIDLLILGH